jgi:hypothetical protein
MFQPPQNTGMTQSMGSVAQAVPKISHMMVNVDKALILPKTIHITINDPITVKAPKLITDGKEKATKSESAAMIKAKEKDKKAEDKENKWKKSVTKWQEGLLGTLKKTLFDNPITNFIKDHWGKLLIGLGFLFLKPAQMKAVWEALKGMATWLWENGPDIFKSVVGALETIVPMISDLVSAIFKWVFGDVVKEKEFKEQKGVVAEKQAILDDNTKKGAGTFWEESDLDFKRRKVREEKDLEEETANLNKMGGYDEKGEFKGKRAGGIDDSLFKKVAVGLGGLIFLLGKFGPQGAVTRLLGKGLSGAFSLVKSYAMPQGGPGLGPRVAGGMGTKMLGGASLAGGLFMAAQDGMEGAELAKEWGVHKAAGVAGAVLGGTDKGLSGAFSNMGKWALIGAGIGSFVPVIGTMIGGVIGGVVGAVIGFFGGEKIAKGFQWVGNKFMELWDVVWGGVKTLASDFKIYLIDPLMDFITKIKDWVVNAIKTIIPEKVLNYFGMGNDEQQAEDARVQDEIKTKRVEDQKAKVDEIDAEAKKGKSTWYAPSTWFSSDDSEKEKQKFFKEIKKDIKGAKRWRGKNREKKVEPINKKINDSPYRDEILGMLSTSQLKLIGRDGLATKKHEENKLRLAARTPEQVAADDKYFKDHSGSSASDDFAGAPSPMVSPTMKADTLNQVQGENAELSSGTNAIVAPTTINNITNNYGSGGEGGTAIYGVPTAQKGTKVKHSNIR